MTINAANTANLAGAVSAVSLTDVSAVAESGEVFGEVLAQKISDTVSQSAAAPSDSAENVSENSPASALEQLSETAANLLKAVSQEAEKSEQPDLLLKRLLELLNLSAEKSGDTDYKAAISFIADNLAAMLQAMPTAEAPEAKMLAAVAETAKPNDFQYLSSDLSNLRTGGEEIGGNLSQRENPNSGRTTQQSSSFGERVQAAVLNETDTVNVQPLTAQQATPETATSSETAQPTQSTQSEQAEQDGQTSQNAQSITVTDIGQTEASIPGASIRSNAQAPQSTEAERNTPNTLDTATASPTQTAVTTTPEIPPPTQNAQAAQSIPTVQLAEEIRTAENPETKPISTDRNTASQKSELTQKAETLFDEIKATVEKQLSNRQAFSNGGGENSEPSQKSSQSVFIRPIIVKNDELEALTGAKNTEKTSEFEPTAAENLLGTATVRTEVYVPEQLRQSEPIDQLAGAVIEKLQTLSNGDTEFVVKLNPDSLGEIVVKVTESNGKVQIELTVENESTGHLLESRTERLTQTLRESGVELENYRVVYRPNENEQTQNQSYGENRNARQDQNQNEQQNHNHSEQDSDEISFSELLATM